MRLLGGIWSVIRLSPLNPKNGRLKFTWKNIPLPVLLVLKFWNIPYKIFLLGQNCFLLRARARVKMEEKCRFWYGASAHEVPSGMTGNKLFCFLFFFYEIFFFPFFETLNGTRRLPLWESREFFFFCSLLKSLLCRQGSPFVKFKPSSFASYPRLRKISGLAVPPSTPFSAATDILWFDWPINLSSFKMKSWLIPYKRILSLHTGLHVSN